MRFILFFYFLQLEVIGGTDKYMAVCRRCYGIDSSDMKSNKQTTVSIKNHESF